MGLREPGFRSGETASPKRDVVVKCDVLLHCSPSEIELGVWARDDLA